MATEFKLPDLGENVESADVVEVLVSPGDKIENETPVIEAETEKAVMEIPSDVSGTVKEVQVKKGDTVKVGQLILTLEEGEEAEADAEKKEEKPKEKKEEPAKKEKAAAREEPKEEEPAKKEEKEEEEAPPEREPARPAAKVEEKEEEKPAPPPEREGAPVPAAPSVRQFAREIGIDIRQVKGTGPGGRISLDDVKAHARSGAAGARPAADGRPATQREKMSKVRRVTASYMAKCWETIPHVTLHDKADVTDIEAVRQRFKKQAEQAGGKLTITAMFVKIAAAALKVYPKVNASIDTEAGEIELHNDYHIGVAVDTERGLLVPVIRDVDRKNILEIAVELTETSRKAREGKLKPDDMSGATFTLTNLGSIGTGFFTPIIGHPQVAILGTGRATMEPVWGDGEFEPRMMAPLSLSIDHRLVDGADGARFLRWIVEAVQNPMLLSLEG